MRSLLSSAAAILCFGFAASTAQAQGNLLVIGSSNGDLRVGNGSYGMSPTSYAHSMVVDASGNTFYAGTFSGTTDFDPSTGTTSVTHNASYSAYTLFLAKYGSSNELLWVNTWSYTAATAAPASYFTGVAGLAADSEGSIYLATTVYTQGTVTGSFDVDPSAATVTVNPKSQDAMLIKMNASGAFQWAALHGSDNGSSDVGLGVTIDSNDNVLWWGNYGTGDASNYYRTKITSSSSGTNVSIPGNHPVNSQFVTKLQKDGTHTWTKLIVKSVSSGLNFPLSVATDSANNVYIAGTVSYSHTMGAGEAGAITTPATLIQGTESAGDGFVWKLNASGTSQWLRYIDPQVYALDVDPDGRPVISGNFASASGADLDPSSSVTTAKTSAGSSDAYVVQLDPSTGAANWIATAGSTGGDTFRRMIVDDSGAIYVSMDLPTAGGSFPTVGAISAVSGNGADAALWKISAAGATQWARVVGGPGSDICRGLAIAGTDIRMALLTTAGNDLDPSASTLAASSGSLTGTVLGAISLQLSDGLLPSLAPEIAVSGNGNAVEDGASSASATNWTDFGTVNIGSTADRTYTVANTGSGTLNLSNYQVTGSQFSIVGTPPASVAANGSASLTLRYTPSAALTQSGGISFTTNDSDENPFSFSIQGTGFVPNAAPLFNNGATQTLTLDEGSAAVSINSLLDVVDANSGQTLEWTVASAPANGALAGFGAATAPTAGTADPISPSGLTYTPGPNYSGSDSFTIQVSDGSATDTITIEVTITDIDPVIVDDDSGSISEDASSGTPVLQLSTTGDSDGLTWSITGGNTGNAFSIDASTGAITLAGSLDYETASSYSLVVSVDDEDPDASADASETITIAVEDVDEVAPVVTVDVLVTTDTTPALSGTVDDASASIWISVGLQTLQATNHGTTWSLADDALSALALGVYDVRVTATDANGNEGNDATTGELEVLSDWEAWRREHFTQPELADLGISGPDANPDGDARPNVFEFLYASDPWTFDAEEAISSSVDGDGITHWSFTRRIHRGGTVLTVTVSDSPFMGGGTTVEQSGTAPVDAAVEQVIYQDLAPVTPSTPRYMQVTIEVE